MNYIPINLKIYKNNIIKILEDNNIDKLCSHLISEYTINPNIMIEGKKIYKCIIFEPDEDSEISYIKFKKNNQILDYLIKFQRYINIKYDNYLIITNVLNFDIHVCLYKLDNPDTKDELKNPVNFKYYYNFYEEFLCND